MQKFFLTRSCLTRYCLITNLFEHRLGQHFPIGGLPIHQPGNHNINGCSIAAHNIHYRGKGIAKGKRKARATFGVVTRAMYGARGFLSVSPGCTIC
jgi:hypothetical protein